MAKFERQCATQDSHGPSGEGMCRPAGRKFHLGRPADRRVDKIGSKRPHTSLMYKGF